jgi:hypothetical protein
LNESRQINNFSRDAALHLCSKLQIKKLFCNLKDKSTYIYMHDDTISHAYGNIESNKKAKSSKGRQNLWLLNDI